jgi:hypothetical protein
LLKTRDCKISRKKKDIITVGFGQVDTSLSGQNEQNLRIFSENPVNSESKRTKRDFFKHLKKIINGIARHGSSYILCSYFVIKMHIINRLCLKAQNNPIKGWWFLI